MEMNQRKKSEKKEEDKQRRVLLSTIATHDDNRIKPTHIHIHIHMLYIPEPGGKKMSEKKRCTKQNASQAKQRREAQSRAEQG